MSPGEEHQEQFSHDVGVGDVEVVFQCRHRYVAAYALVDVFLACCYGVLAYLEAHLRRGVVDEATELAGEVWAAHVPGRRGLLVWIAIAVNLWLRLLGGRWWWRAQVWDLGDVLRSWVEELGGLRWRRKGLSLHRGGCWLADRG